MALSSSEVLGPSKAEIPNSPEALLAQMTLIDGDFTVYEAGLPSFPRGFTRDTLIAGELWGKAQMISDGLKLAAHLQGQRRDPITGEEPGKIFHEWDVALQGGVELSGRPGKTTEYNAVETTALFILAHEQLIKMTGDTGLVIDQKAHIQKAAEYIMTHSTSGSFEEDPNYSDADDYALGATYWKDSGIPRKNGRPTYPVVYSLADIQNMAALRAAGRLLGSQEYLDRAEVMRQNIHYLVDSDSGYLITGIDLEGRIEGITSDGLHALNYLEPGDVSDEMLNGIIRSSSVLETEMGYRTMDPVTAETMVDKYHATTVWTHEQAVINKGAMKHLKALEERDLGESLLAQSLRRVIEVSSRVYSEYLVKHPGSFPEIFHVNSDGTITPGGNDPQLWAIAAKRYFDRVYETPPGTQEPTIYDAEIVQQPIH